MTQEESIELIEWIQEATERGIHKGLRKWFRGAALAFLFLLGANIFVWQTGKGEAASSRDAIVQSGTVVSIAGCNRDFETIQTLRGVLIASKQFQKAALKRGDITQRQFDQAGVYYKEQLDKLALPNCEAAGSILTEDPDAIPTIPKPKVPEDAE